MGILNQIGARRSKTRKITPAEFAVLRNAVRQVSPRDSEQLARPDGEAQRLCLGIILMSAFLIAAVVLLW